MGMTITQLTTAPSTDDIFNQMITWLVAMGLPADQWRKGGVARSVLRVVAMTFANFAQLISFIASMGFLDTATGDFLTLLAFYVYGVTRVVATFATGQVLASNSSGGIYTYTPGEFIVINTITKKSFVNVSTFTLNPGDSNIPVDIEATELGTDSNSSPGQITTMGISDTGVSCTNPLAVLGLDAWTDEILRAACRAKLGSLSLMGPRGAYLYAIAVAVSPTTGQPVNVNRSSVSASSSTGTVTVYIASPTGPVTSDDIAGVVNSIERWARPDSVTATVLSVTVVSYTATLTVYARNAPGLVASTIHDEVEAALLALQENYAIGGHPKTAGGPGFLYQQEIEATATSADPAIYAVESVGGADLSVPPGHVAAIASTVTVRLITSPAVA